MGGVLCERFRGTSSRGFHSNKGREVNVYCFDDDKAEAMFWCARKVFRVGDLWAPLWVKDARAVPFRVPSASLVPPDDGGGTTEYLRVLLDTLAPCSLGI